MGEKIIARNNDIIKNRVIVKLTFLMFLIRYLKFSMNNKNKSGINILVGSIGIRPCLYKKISETDNNKTSIIPINLFII